MKISFSGTSIKNITAAKIRDLNYFRLGDALAVFSVDSSGGVGHLPNDPYQCTSFQEGGFIIKVALVEMMCAGVRPVSIYLDFAFDRPDYLEEYLRGMRKEAADIGLTEIPIFVTHGTYRNPDCSAAGMSIFGVASESTLRINRSMPGDYVYAIGLPKFKNYVERMTTTAEIGRVLGLDYVHEVLPGGSHGIRHEAHALAKSNGLEFEEIEGTLLTDMAELSCGAAATILVTVAPEDAEKLENLDIRREINRFGILHGNKEKSSPREKEDGIRAEVAESGDITVDENWKIVSVPSVSYGAGLKEEDSRRDVAELDMELIRKSVSEMGEKKAEPLLVVNNFNFGMQPHGKEAIGKAGDMLRNEYGMNTETQFTGSTEDNFKTTHSGIAVRVFGVSGV